VKKEAAWVIANILHSFKADPSAANSARASALVALGVMKPLAAFLDVNDAAMQKLMLEATGSLFEAGEVVARHSGKPNQFLVSFDEFDGVDKLEALQEHPNEEVYNAAVALLDKYFGEDDAEDENLLPAAQNGAFAFGVAPAANAQPAFVF